MSACQIPLTNGGFAIVDSDSFGEISKSKWYRGSDGYARRVSSIKGVKDKKQKLILMHRVINQTPSGLQTDHKNGNRLDNRKSNLRVASPLQNSANRKKDRGFHTSIYKGVCLSGKKWKAAIKWEHKTRHLGMFDSERDAALAYNAAATLLFGDFARLNIIGENPC